MACGHAKSTMFECQLLARDPAATNSVIDVVPPQGLLNASKRSAVSSTSSSSMPTEGCSLMQCGNPAKFSNASVATDCAVPSSVIYFELDADLFVPRLSVFDKYYIRTLSSNIWHQQ